MRAGNNKLRKALTMVCCALLLVAISVGATLAYLTDTEAVTNTFTVGHVDISLDEAKTNEAGKPLKEDVVVADRTQADRINGFRNEDDQKYTNTYHLIPGQSYTKDPTITVHAGSEDCYVVAKIVVTGAADSPLVYDASETVKLLGLKHKVGDESYNVITGGVLETTIANPPVVGTDGVVTWTTDDVILTQKNDNGTFTFMVYYRKPVEAASDVTKTLFTNINIPDAWDNAEIQTLDDLKIEVTAYAMQAAGFEGEGEGVQAAYQACQGQFKAYDHNGDSSANP